MKPHIDVLDELQRDGFELPAPYKKILENLFGDDVIVIRIEKEFKKGRSHAMTLQVGLIKKGASASPRTVVKLGPGELIRQEWKAYHKYIKGNLRFIPDLDKRYFCKDEDEKEWGA